jgi:hypothetical protein
MSIPPSSPRRLPPTAPQASARPLLGGDDHRLALFRAPNQRRSIGTDYPISSARSDASSKRMPPCRLKSKAATTRM